MLCLTFGWWLWLFSFVDYVVVCCGVVMFNSVDYSGDGCLGGLFDCLFVLFLEVGLHLVFFVGLCVVGLFVSYEFGVG